MKKYCLFILLLILVNAVKAQQLFFPRINYSDSVQLEKSIPLLAQQVIDVFKEANKGTYYDVLFRLQLVAGQFASVENTLKLEAAALFPDSANSGPLGLPYKLYSTAMLQQNAGGTFEEAYQNDFQKRFDSYNEDNKSWAQSYFENDIPSMKTSLDKKIKSLSNSDSISVSDAIALCRGYCSYIVYSKSNSISKKIIGDIESSKYIREDSVLIKMPDGGNIALTIVRDKKIGRPQPVVLMFNIYAGHDAGACKDAVQYGYTGIIANTRGKRLSTDIIEPFEHDAYDAYYIIDWISKQPWCNGKVGMYGGSYLGFSQWATAKHLHPALKTIVPQVSVGAGIDYPMENGVFMSYMLRWIHFVTDNKLTNDGDFRDDAKWESVYNNYYTKGTSFRSLDQLEGRKK